MPFSEDLRRLRRERFWPQAELARRAGLSKYTIMRLEAGSSAPTMRSVSAIAAALGVDPRELAAPDETVEVLARGKTAA
jgi:transcriptional regulator with XRE-family HTH domain